VLSVYEVDSEIIAKTIPMSIKIINRMPIIMRIHCAVLRFLLMRMTRGGSGG
jgi:hypothetical protein